MDEERSEAGDPIYRYEPRSTGWQAPDMEDSSLEAITQHIEAHVGKVDLVWHEMVSDLVHIDVHQIAPTEDRPYWTLVTSGMSDLPMPTPPERQEWAFSELMICLPKEWKMGSDHFKDETNYWPVRWLKMLARLPHEYETWLSGYHTIPNGDPAEPFCEGVPFTCMMLAPPKTVSTEFWELKVREDKHIHFFALIPLHEGEVNLKLAEGAQELDRLLDLHRVTELVDLARPDVSINR
ncbi:MAG TPA: suppressor of fused domain protein [Verrucomicrobiales bacterium]|jgi:hypothetical protein|nr:suppressor of fused domain protein [Verrucomicrobiales bacterium]